MVLFDLPLSALGLLRDAVFAVVLVLALSVAMREGLAGLLRRLIGALRHIHGVDDLIKWALRREVRSFLKQVDPKSFGDGNRERKSVSIPEKGILATRTILVKGWAWSQVRCI